MPKRSPSSTNSTTVRSVLLHGLEVVAPGFAAQKAFDWWCRPSRVKRLRAPREGRPFSIDTTEGEVKAWEWGSASNETVLLVHGWSASSVVMERNAEPLVAAGKHVVAVDLPKPAVQRRIARLLKEGNARVTLPVTDPAAGVAAELEHAGADLLTQTPEIAAWLAAMGLPLDIGNIAYQIGRAHV